MHTYTTYKHSLNSCSINSSCCRLLSIHKSENKSAMFESKSFDVKKINRIYLILYNSLQVLGWSYLLFLILSFYLDASVNKDDLYETVKIPLFTFQSLAVLEVAHAILKIVPSSPAITLQQVTSRIVVVWGVLWAAESARNSIGLPLLLFAWSVTEIIRYSNYALVLLNAVPYFLIWLRYTTFYILYPIGVTGELLCMYCAHQEISENGQWSIPMPNKYNTVFYYHYFLAFFGSLYIPIFPHLYLHMMAQRKKVLGKKTITQSGTKLNKQS